MVDSQSIKRSLEEITQEDLQELYDGSVNRLHEYFIEGKGKKWLGLYDIQKPLAVALCQGAAMHYCDKVNGVKDFDVWFFYPYNKENLPYRTHWKWDYSNPKFGRNPDDMSEYSGRRVDVLVRSIKDYTIDKPTETICQYLLYTKTDTAKKLAQKSVVLLHPHSELGNVIWHKNQRKR